MSVEVDLGGIYGRDVKTLFAEMNTNFPNLKAIKLSSSGFYGLLDPTGLEHVHNITFWRTNIEGFSKEPFKFFTNLTGK